MKRTVDPYVMSTNKVRALALLGVVIAVWGSGCAFIPTPVRLMNKPHFGEQAIRRNLKVCVIVKDERPQTIQKVNMCGLMRNGYMIPTSFAFLAHAEHLDTIVAHHVKKNLEHCGYTVLRSYPEPPDQLSEEKVAHKSYSKEDRKAAWADKGTQADKKAKKKKNKGSEIEELDDDHLSPWGLGIDTSGADAVVEVKIRKYWSDTNYLGVFAWMSINLAVCDADDPKRTVLFGKKVRGFGYGTGLTPIEAYNIPLNACYWFVLHGIEKTVASPEFLTAVATRDEPA